MATYNQLFIFGKPCFFKPEDRLEVEVHYPFVALLSEGEKKTFYRRLCTLMRSVQLHEKGVELTKCDRMLIAAPAVILTFGFQKFHWGNFRHVFVYPVAYRNNRTGRYHHGETSPSGAVVVNWERVKEGIDDPDDAIHLLYHEYAHALILSRASRLKRRDRRFVRAASSFTSQYFNRVDIRTSSLIREYGFTNEMEFFAVLVEVFMERADDLKNEHSFLYRDLIELLKLEKWESIILQQAAWFR